MSESISSPQNDVEAPQLCRPRIRCHWTGGLIAGLILGSFAAVVLLVVCWPQYEATAQIQICSVKPDFLVDHPPMPYKYDALVNTQMALFRSPLVIDRALEQSDVARLPIVIQQGGNRRDWLMRNLRIKHIPNSEIVNISIATDTEDASEKIVNAVVNAYFNFTHEHARKTSNDLVGNLRTEERRQQQVVQTFQETIRSKTREAALKGTVAGTTGMNIGLDQRETLAKDIALADTRLTALRAQRKSIIERMNNPQRVPISILIQMNPELKTLHEQRGVLTQQREELGQVYIEDDPRMVEIIRQIERIDKRVKSLASGMDSSALEAVQDHFRFQEEMNLFQIEQEIRTQEILVEELTNKYRDHLIQNVEQAENMLDVSRDIAQLERANKTLERINDRILTITSEQRAPGQITQLSPAVPSIEPKPRWTVQIAIAGIGFILFFFLPLFCVACWRCGCLRKPQN